MEATIIRSIQNTLDTRGGRYSQYRCKQVSWDDVSRLGAGTGNVSSMGSNITDTRLYSKDGKLLYVVRPNNWDEKLGKVSANEISIIHKNKPITLHDYLKKFSKNAKYALKGDALRTPGAEGSARKEIDLTSDKDTTVSIRFQTTFLPVGDIEHGNIEVAPEVYTYGNKNIQLLCTSQGTSVQQGEAGRNKLYHHEVDKSGVIHRYWFEVERSNHGVGGQQTETEAEIQDALARGKSIATCIGIKAMGTRFNTLMTIQIPTGSGELTLGSMGGATLYGFTPKSASFNSSNSWSGLHMRGRSYGGKGSASRSREPPPANYYSALRENDSPPRVSAGRLSRGSEHDTWGGIKDEVVRDKNRHITVTVVLYNAVAGGVPTESDVVAAIDDLEALYNSCRWTGKLSEPSAQFMHNPISSSFNPPPQAFNSSLKSFPTAASFDPKESPTDAMMA